ncbi:MAG: polysaccharide export protein [Proteobacteria bacterium]|nr:polysaccharide export protein [Pseudomonadota bacterium]
MNRYYFFLLFVFGFSLQGFAYELDVGDVLRVDVFGETDLSLDAEVDSNGYIEYPFIGKIHVSGKTVDMIKKDINTFLLDGYLINPQITVFIKQYKPFYIEGEISSPGSYPYEPGLTVRKAITLAGGLTERASSKKMYVIRASGSSEPVKIGMDEELQAGDVLDIKESFW